MASFIVKQMVGDKLNAAKGAVGGDEKKDEKPSEEDEEAAAELIEQRRKEEEKRQEKHRRMEEEREAMRQTIRDKYNLKKKDDIEPAPGAVGRSRGPGEKAPLPGVDGNEGGDSMIPKDLDDFKNKMTNLPSMAQEKFGEVQDKCSIQ